MRTIEKLRLKSIFLFFLLGIFAAVSVAPVQAQDINPDKQTKKKTKIRDQRKKKTKTRDLRTKKAPNNDVAIDDSFNNFLVTNPPRSSQEDLQKWNRIVTKMQGIEGFDPVGNIIGEYPAEKTQGSEVVLHFFNNWVPLDSKKHSCCGKLKKIQDI